MKMHTDNEDYRRRLAAEAERLRASGALGRSDLLIRLFDFLLQASLSGRAPKEIEIAHEVFEKSGEIRAGQDAPVRTYVHRLRRKLEEAYTDADANLGDATDRLVLLRGEYRLTLADEPLLVKLVSPPFRKRGRSWIGAAAVLLLAVNLGLWFVFTGQPARISSDNVGSTAFWKPLSIPHRPVIVVMGDHYLFGESPGSMEMTHLVRRFDVNSPDDLEAYLAANPNEVGHYVDLGVHYVPVSVALNESLSLDPAVVDWIEKLPLKLRVPVAPLNLPVPLKTFATPLTVTGDGAALLTAHAWVWEDETTCNFNPLAPASAPAPEKGSHELAAEPVPLPLMVLAPSVPVPWPETRTSCASTFRTASRRSVWS